MLVHSQMCYFVRCILPNDKKLHDIFDEKIVIPQLKCSSIMAYQELMLFGYPIRVNMNKLQSAYNSNDDYFFSTNELLIAIGFEKTDFKIGNEVIFFRCNKTHLTEALFDPDSVNENLKKLKKNRIIKKWRILFSCMKYYLNRW